jgi:hypothetical protein
MTSETLSYIWRWWVDVVGSVGLPLDKQMTALFVLAFVFYAIGVAFKALTEKEK